MLNEDQVTKYVIRCSCPGTERVGLQCRHSLVNISEEGDLLTVWVEAEDPKIRILLPPFTDGDLEYQISVDTGGSGSDWTTVPEGCLSPLLSAGTELDLHVVVEPSTPGASGSSLVKKCKLVVRSDGRPY